MKTYLFFMLAFISCSTKRNKEIVINDFVLKSYAAEYKLIASKGGEGEYGGQLIINSDTFWFEKSKYANDLKEYLTEQECKNCFTDETGNYVDINPGTPEPFFRYAAYMTHYFIWDSTNVVKKLLKQPKVSGKGVTGVFIKDMEPGVNLSMYAQNLDYATQMKAIEMFRSIRKTGNND